MTISTTKVARGFVGNAGEWVPIDGGGGGDVYPQTFMFAATDAMQDFTLPANASAVTSVVVRGAQGAGATGGNGGVIRALLRLVPGDIYKVQGATTAQAVNKVSGFFRTADLASFLLVAGNGGGCGTSGAGGIGGIAPTAGSASGAGPGGPATPTAGGSAGSAGSMGSPGHPGTEWVGGAHLGGAGRWGGGGGGDWYDVGGKAGNGGGGISAVADDPAVLEVTHENGANVGNGLVEVTCYLPERPAQSLVIVDGLVVPASSDAAVDLATVLSVDLSLVTAARLADLAAQRAQEAQP